MRRLKQVLSLVMPCLLLAAAVAQAQTKIDLAVFHPERNAWSVALKWWIDEVDKATAGRVKVVPHWAGALVTANETLKSVRDGAVPAGVTSMAAVSGQLPAVAFLEAIGGMPDTPDKYVAALNDLRAPLEALFAKQNVEFLWSQGSAGLIVLCRDRHLRTPADWKGRKVRTAGRWQAEQLQTLGAAPVATDVSEQYLALQNRTIDCALSVPVLASALKLHEVAPKVTLLRLPVNLSSYLVNKGVWEKLSPEDRATVKRIGIEAEKRSAQHLEQASTDAVELMRSQKGDIYGLTPAEVAEFRRTIDPAFNRIDAQGGDVGKTIAATARKYW